MSANSSNRVSRRNLLAAATVAGAAIAGGAADSAFAHAPAADEKWDIEADVVCVGSGVAGGTAAVTAASKGAKVVMIEKLPALGGTTIKSGGVAWIPNNPLLRARGGVDRREDCLRFLARYAFPQNYAPDAPMLGLHPHDYKLLEAFYDQGSAAVDLLQTSKAIRFREFKLPGTGAYPADYTAMPENKIQGRAIEPADAPGPDQGGGTMIQLFETWLQAHKVPILLEHRASKLIVSDGRVIGVEALNGEKRVRIRARRGVVFASGGYSHNVELVDLHQISLVGACAMSGSTGDFVGLASSVGARMGSMHTAWRSQAVLDEALASRELGYTCFILPGDAMILVNKYGRRIVNEKRNYHDRTRSHLVYDPTRVEYPNLLQFMVFDSRTIDAFGGAYPLPSDLNDAPSVVRGETLSELARSLDARLSKIADRTGGVRLAPEFSVNLESAVASFNGYARSGRDNDFHRGEDQFDLDSHSMYSALREGTKFGANEFPNPTMHPFADKGPYFAIILGAGALDTNSGPLVNEHAQLLDSSGAPIPGLYGAGNCIASPLREAYVGPGGTIGVALTFGYIAGLNAAQAVVPA